MIEHTWRLADMTDVDEIVALGVENFKHEIDNVFIHSTPAATRNCVFAILNQIYYPGTQLLTVCRESGSNRLLAYTMAKSNERTMWSDDLMVCIQFAHIDLTLPPKLRIKLVKDMMEQWEKFARYAGNPVICSTTMRHEQTAFLKLHERAGYSVRGSYAYKRLE